jgi:hypothetical protein
MPNQEDIFFAYCLQVAGEFEARLRRMAHFTSNSSAIGSSNEAILRDFLSRHMPGKMAVGQGFVHSISDGHVSKQCDILIYDQHQFVPVYSDGPVVVVQPQAAAVVIEVKTQLNKEAITNAVENIASSKPMARAMVGIVFAFNSGAAKTVLGNFKASMKSHDADFGPDAILLLEKGIVILSWRIRGRVTSIHESKAGNYEVWRVKPQKKGSTVKGIVIACLLYLVFDRVGGLGYDTDLPSRLLSQVLNKYADKYDSFAIGA